MNNSDLIVQANADLMKVQLQIDDMIADSLIAFAVYKSIVVEFNREYYRFDVIINDTVHYLFINGKGSNIDKYKSDILDIIKIEVIN